MSYEDHQGEVAVVGLGYVGLCLSGLLAEAGLRVHGVDVDEDRVATVEDGVCPIEEPVITDLVERFASDGTITASSDYTSVETSDVVIVTVGTPLGETSSDLSGIREATRAIGDCLRPEQLVVYRSTLPAGTTEDEIAPILAEHSELTPGEGVALAFCPERMAEGSAYEDLTEVPVVVGGLTDRCRQRAEAFWSDVGLETVGVSDPTAAELTKLADNWWIDLNIAMANEVALLAERLGTDASEVIEAANTLPKGDHHVNILRPGAGVGGSCLVKDPWFVVELGERHGVDVRTPRVSREVNDAMPGHVVDLVRDELGGLADRRIAVLGYAFKAGTDDSRHTPASGVVEGLLDDGAEVVVTDPHVPDDTIAEETGVAVADLDGAIEGRDAAVLVTDHELYRELSAVAVADALRDDGAVIDGRGVFEPEAFDGLSIGYRRVGLGREVGDG